MKNILDYPAFHVIIPVITSIIINGIIYSQGWKKNSQKNIKNPLIPPGYIIGFIWIFIFTLLGYAHYLLYKLKEGFSLASISIILLFIFCMAYPFLTSGFKEKKGLILNLITLILAFIVSLIVIVQSINIFLYFIPLLLWASYVNFAYVVECSNFSKYN